jgi:hypothetical protein
MQRHSPGLLLSSVALACTMACGADLPETASDRQSTVGSRITLAGCVGGGEAAGEYALREIRVDTGPPQTPALPETPPVPGVTEGAWVRLQAPEAQLRPLLGQRVRLTGEVTETGENTIGTAGVVGEETPSGDTSQAAGQGHYSSRQKLEAGRIARQSMANGRAAEIRVVEITPTGEPCR